MNQSTRAIVQADQPFIETRKLLSNSLNDKIGEARANIHWWSVLKNKVVRISSAARG